MSRSDGVTRPIKLVIWDLDDTFWDGTFEEGSARYRQDNHDRVIELARRGIISSICSKNHPDRINNFLAEKGLSAYVVLSRIGWQPKGEMVAGIIEDAQLRAENVLFLDDNHLNLEEAKFYNPGIQTALPDVIGGMLEWASLKGKDDSGLTRLAQYKMLEARHREEQSFTRGNEEFLRQSTIRVVVEKVGDGDRSRVHELIERTNQLNFTKKRIGIDSLGTLLGDACIEARMVRVRDRYGDYGVCGFYAKRGDCLEHFVFSCRILNMGVEQWLYHRLGKPGIVIEGEVVSDLQAPLPDWIDSGEAGTVGPVSPLRKNPKKGPKVLMKGGCDLSQMKDLLGTARVDTEFTYTGKAGGLVHFEHTEIIKRSVPSVVAVHGEVIDRLPFLDRAAFSTRLLAGEHDVLVYSPLMDYTQGLYRLRDTDFVVPYGDYAKDITDRRLWPELLRTNAKRGMNEEFLSWFAERFVFEGGIGEREFATNLRAVFGKVSAEIRVFLLTGAEIESPHPLEKGRRERHIAMNRVLAAVADELPNASILDARKYVTDSASLTDNIRHYSRRVYFMLAQELGAELARLYGLEDRAWARVFRYAKVACRKSAGGFYRGVARWLTEPSRYL